MISKYRNKDDHPLLKLIDEPILQHAKGLVLEPGSPYVRRFHTIILRMIASGLIEK